MVLLFLWKPCMWFSFRITLFTQSVGKWITIIFAKIMHIWFVLAKLFRNIVGVRFFETLGTGMSDISLTRPALRLTSACLLTYILRALFCDRGSNLARPRYNIHIYLQNDTSARVCRCHDSSSEHTQEPNYSTEFPLYTFPHPIAFSPGAGVAVVARILWVGLSCQSIRVASRA